ncbi:ATP-binding domain-containing protein [Mycobacteroides abscessus]|uniref:ATP-binding domain-containing protein n=1 Tax=Mycobacteroides abscessus TaxID=36809 RepID=UPI001E2B4502
MMSFRPVVDRIRTRILNQHPGMSGGTVHSVQGQEAPVVILVLGGDPDRPRSKTWAGDEPHLLNVAVSRAQHRLYVIGDHDSWSPIGYFNYLAETLPRQHAQPIAAATRRTPPDPFRPAAPPTPWVPTAVTTQISRRPQRSQSGPPKRTV